MLKFVLPLFMVAASSAQTFFYPTTASTSSMYRYGYGSSYYPTYMPTAYYPTSTYIRSGSYFYPYSRTHMTMTYPTFMARSDGSVYDASKLDASKHAVRPVDAAPAVMATGHHVPMTVGHGVPTTPVAVTGQTAFHHGAHPGHHAIAVPYTHFGYQPVSVAGAIAAPKDMIPTIAAEPSTVAGHHHHTRHATAHPVAAPATGPVAYAVPIPAPAGAYGVPVAFEYGPSQFAHAGRVDTAAPVGMTGGASFVPAGAVPVDVKGAFDVPAPVAGSHHEGKHGNFEGKKSAGF